MRAPRIELVRPGLTSGAASLFLAGGATVTVLASGWNRAEIPDRLAITGLVVFGVALLAGSARGVGLATIPILGSAVAAAATSPESIWIAASMLGCGWFVALELAWFSIERRETGRVGRDVIIRRVREVSTIVLVSLVVSTVGLLLAGVAPERSVAMVGLAVVSLLGALTLARRRVDAPPVA